MRLDAEGWTWPVPIAADGRKPRISDGFEKPGNMKKRGGEGHRGQDIMYRKRLPLPRRHPWSSPGYMMFPRTPAIAAHEAAVFRCGRIDTGWHVILEHGDGIGTGYYHMSELVPGIVEGAAVRAGQPLGIVGGSPIGYGLVHLHFDVAVQGRFIDAGILMLRWQHTPLERAWGAVGRVA